MSLLDDLQQATPKPKPQGCKTCGWLKDQTEEVRSFVRSWAHEGHSHTQLYRMFIPYGYDLSLGALKNHLGRCYGV